MKKFSFETTHKIDISLTDQEYENIFNKNNDFLRSKNIHVLNKEEFFASKWSENILNNMDELYEQIKEEEIRLFIKTKFQIFYEQKYKNIQIEFNNFLNELKK